MGKYLFQKQYSEIYFKNGDQKILRNLFQKQCPRFILKIVLRNLFQK